MAVTFLRADILAKLCRCFYIQFQIGISHLKHPNCNAVNNKLLLFYGDTFYVEKMNYKAERYNGKVIKVDTFKTKASQFDHTDDSFTKKKLSQRFAKLSDGTVV